MRIQLVGLLAATFFAAAAMGCAAPADEAAESGDQHVERDEGDRNASNKSKTAAPEQLSPQKVAEVPAANEGKLGVSSWVVYATVKNSDVYLTSLGTNLDGDVTTVMHVDLGTKAFLVFENKSRDGSRVERTDSSEALADYGLELQAVLKGIASLGATAGGGAHTQSVNGVTDCVMLGLTGVVLGILGTVAVLALPLEGAAVTTAAAVGGTLAVVLGPSAMIALDENNLSVSGVLSGVESLGGTVSNMVDRCAKAIQ